MQQLGVHMRKVIRAYRCGSIGQLMGASEVVFSGPGLVSRASRLRTSQPKLQ